MSKRVIRGPGRKPAPLSTNPIQILREEIAYEMYICKKSNVELLEMFRHRTTNVAEHIRHVRQYPGSFNPKRDQKE